MKYYHYTIIIAVLILIFGIMMETGALSFKKATDAYTDMEKAFYEASDAAAGALVSYSVNGLELNKDAAYNTFINTLLAATGGLDDVNGKEELEKYIPGFFVLDIDGIYVYFSDLYKGNDGYTYETRTWSELIPYTYSDDYFSYTFTLDGECMVIDKNGHLGENHKGTYDELISIPEINDYVKDKQKCILYGKEPFIEGMHTAITTVTEKTLSDYITRYNEIAKSREISYTFTLPVSDASNYLQNVDSPSVIAFFQGYPISVKRNIYFNEYSLAGSEIKESRLFYVTDEGWYRLYHTGDCETLKNTDITLLHPYTSVKECVNDGAYACPKCIKSGIYPPETLYKQN